MKALIFSLFIVCCWMPLVADVSYPKMTEDQKGQFYDELRQGIEKSLKQFNQVKEKITKGNLNLNKQMELTNAATAVEVKYTLYKNFYNTSSIQSPKIRIMLKRLFNKDFITMEDLKELKQLVAEEKVKMGETKKSDG